MTEAEKGEADILRTLRSRYERQGYTFVSHPTEDLLPDFLRGFRPDALAISSRGSVVIEVKTSRSSAGGKSLAQIAERVSAHPNWKFEVYYAGDFPRALYESPGDDVIRKLISEVKGLAKAGQTRASLVMGWAALEAITRSLRSGGEGRSGPMIPSEIVEWLTREGHIDNAKGRVLRQLIKKRNAVVHGDLSEILRPEDLNALLSTLDLLATELD